MTRRLALTRAVSRSFADCELTHLDREPIDVEVARRQHTEYEAALERCGCRVERLPEEPALPDAVFVEDTALVLDEFAVILRPGAVSRRAETGSVARALAPFRRVEEMKGPGTLDGGDVLKVGRTLFVGLSTRSDLAGIEELRGLVAAHGYSVVEARVSGCLHLKSAVTGIADRTLLVNPDWIDAGAFGDCRVIEIDPREPHAANALAIGDRLVYPTAFPATAARLRSEGFELETVDLSELAKAEGAVTCCSLVFRA